MANPEVIVSVAAAIGPLQTGMQQAEQTVASSTAAMASTVEKAGLGAKFDRWMTEGGRGAKRLGLGIGGAAAATAAATGDIEGALNALPGVFGAVAGAAYGLGGAIYEAFSGAKAEAEALKKEVEELERRNAFKAMARDADRLLRIEQERDELSRIELSKQRELALVRQSINQLETEGATQEAVAMVAAQERLIIAKAENAVKAEMAKRESEQAKRAAEIAEFERKRAEEAEKAAAAKREALAKANTEMEDNAALVGIAREQDEFVRRQLELEQELREIARERKAIAKEIGDVAADDLIRSRQLVAETKARNDLDEIAQKRMDEYNKEREDARKKEQEAIVENLKTELEGRKKVLGEVRDVSSFTQSVSTSIGGSFSVANLGASAAMRTIAEKQQALQARIAELVAEIARKVGGVEGGIA